MLDLLICGASVITGDNSPARSADVWVDQGRIASFCTPGEQSASHAREVINAEGLTLAPGFIDVHTHDDALMLCTAKTGEAHPKLSQGVTTVVTGNCGVSLAPLTSLDPPAPLDILGREGYRFDTFSDYLNALTAARPACNTASLVGHTTLRVKHLENLEREATSTQAQAMASEVERALNEGAFGLSTGVYYPPARAATTAELITVARPLADAQAPLTMHLRNEAEDIDAAMQEAFDVATAVGCPLVLSHHKLIGTPNHGRSRQTLAAIDAAARRLDVCMDCYPYVASSTMLMLDRVASSTDIRITWSRPHPETAGRSLFDLAREQGRDPIDLAKSLMPAGAIYFAMSDDDVSRILAHPLTLIGSDGLAHDTAPHPRLWGSFSRVLGLYQRERQLFSLETAIHKMTGASAKRFGLNRTAVGQAARGLIAPGFAADLVLFNASTVVDGATFDTPTQPSRGIERVYVNGRLAALHGEIVDGHAGIALKRPSAGP